MKRLTRDKTVLQVYTDRPTGGASTLHGILSRVLQAAGVKAAPRRLISRYTARLECFPVDFLLIYAKS